MEIELDRQAINKYYAWFGLHAIVVGITIVSLILGFMWFVDIVQKDSSPEIVWNAILQGFACFAIVWITFMILGVLIGYLNFWRYSKSYSENLHVTIEGPYLRIIEYRKVYSDRKIHFNQLMDYTILQDIRMKKLNMKTIRIGTNQAMSGNNGMRWHIDIPGVINAEKTRDFLADYDYQHEKDV